MERNPLSRTCVILPLPPPLYPLSCPLCVWSALGVGLSLSLALFFFRLNTAEVGAGEEFDKTSPVIPPNEASESLKYFSPAGVDNRAAGRSAALQPSHASASHSICHSGHRCWPPAPLCQISWSLNICPLALAIIGNNWTHYAHCESKKQTNKQKTRQTSPCAFCGTRLFCLY